MTDATTTYASVYLMTHNYDKYDNDSYIRVFLQLLLIFIKQQNRIENVKHFD